MCKVFLCAFVLGLSCPALLFAQTQTGVIKGVVTDPSNQPVPGATTTIASKALITGSATTASGPTGAYQFIALPPGVYNVTFELEGFKKLLKESITVSIGVVSTVDGRLGLATLAESVTVTGRAPTVDVQSNAVGTDAPSLLLQSLPRDALSCYRSSDGRVSKHTMVNTPRERTSAVSATRHRRHDA